MPPMKILTLLRQRKSQSRSIALQFCDCGTIHQHTHLRRPEHPDNQFIQIAGSSQGISYSTAGTVYGGIIANNYFWIAGTAAAISLAATGIQNLSITNNIRSGGAAILTVTGTLDNSVTVTNNHPLDADDVFKAISVSGTALSLVGLRTNFVLVNAPESAVTVSRLTSRRLGETVTLKCDSPDLTLQNNENTDGFLLKGGENFTFGPKSLITLYKGNGGYWTEISRSA